jgi:hypothetical protein
MFRGNIIEACAELTCCGATASYAFILCTLRVRLSSQSGVFSHAVRASWILHAQPLRSTLNQTNDRWEQLNKCPQVHFSENLHIEAKAQNCNDSCPY